MSLFKLPRASVLFSRKFQMQFNVIAKVKTFLIPLSGTFLNPKILGFLFCTKSILTWAVKCEKLNLKRKVIGNLLDKLRKLSMNGMRNLEIFSRPKLSNRVIENSRQYLRLRTDMLEKTIVG